MISDKSLLHNSYNVYYSGVPVRILIFTVELKDIIRLTGPRVENITRFFVDVCRL